MKHTIQLLLILTLAFKVSSSSSVLDTIDANKKRVFRYDITGNISPGTWRQTKQAFEEADSFSADLFVIQLNTYGGTVLDADSIRTIILDSDIPTYVFINNNAASAGALISIACDSIYMKAGASIGAATVVDQTGDMLPDKYQSYMRSVMRATAEAQGKDTVVANNDTTIRWRRNPDIAEAMVDEQLFIEGVSDTGKVLTMTPTEAIELGFCEGIAEDIYEVIEKSGFENYEIREYKPTTLEKLIGFLVSPYVSGILIMIIIGGIYFEMQSPGIGFPIAASITAAILYFSPLYLEGLAENWEIIIFAVGVFLIAVEIFVIPGFGIAGISGIIMVMAGLILSMIGNVRFNFDGVATSEIIRAFVVVLAAITAAFIFSLWGSKKVFVSSGGPFKNLALKMTEDKADGFIGVDTDNINMVGRTGVAETVLRPSGKIDIEGDIFDASAEIGYIEKGEKIKVMKYAAGQLYVQKA